MTLTQRLFIVAVNHAVFHNEGNSLSNGNVFKRISGHSDQVGSLSNSNATGVQFKSMMRGIGAKVYRASSGLTEKRATKTPATVRRLTPVGG